MGNQEISPLPPISPLNTIMIADKFERKYQFVIASLIMGIAFILRGLLIHDYVALAAAVYFAFVSRSKNILILTVSHVPNLTFYVPNLTGG